MLKLTFLKESISSETTELIPSLYLSAYAILNPIPLIPPDKFSK